MNNNDKTWMYRRLEKGFLTNEFCLGVEAFVAFSLSHHEFLSDGKLRCPCNRKKCQNKCYLDENTVKVHLCRYGFVSNYDCWYFHGEEYVRPFYKNINLDVPTSSYHLPNVEFTPQQNPTSHPICFKNTAQKNVHFDQNFENEYHHDEKNKANRASEPACAGTGTSKHIVGSKTYNAHYHSMKAARQGTDPTSWDLYLHTHRRVDGSFVDERSRLVNQSMKTHMDESLTPLDDGTIPEQPSSEEVNSMFKNVVGGKKKGRMYGCRSMARSIYPQDMAPRPRGGHSASSSSQETARLRKQVEQQDRVIKYLRMDLQASQRREEDREMRDAEMRKENEEMRHQLDGRMTSMEDHIRRLVSGIPQVPPTNPGSQSYSRPAYDIGTPVRGRSTPHRSISSSSRVVPRRKMYVHDRTTTRPPHRFSQQWVDPSQDFGHRDDDSDDDDADVASDDDETQTP